MSTVLILPGYADSGPDHWQSLWQQAHPEFGRVVQRDWHYAICADWVETLARAIRAIGSPVVVAAHSLACIAVAHCARDVLDSLRGALLVAPPDVDTASLDERRVVGRFSTFLEHYKKHADGTRVTRYNALFHWRVPEGMEIRAGQEVGRHHCMTHAYWREGGPEFAGVNIMGVAHGREKDWVLAHKAAIDAHLEDVGIPVLYTNVFWGGRSEIKPSEISPIAYRAWCAERGIDPAAMTA